jgi:ankyrin repeat protein
MHSWFSGLVIVVIAFAGGCDGTAKLSQAVAKGDLSGVQRLVAEGADLEARDEYGDTVLHRAAMNDRGAEIVRLLLDRGAKVNAKNHQGWTPLHRVTTEEVAALLLDNGADLNAKDKFGETPLHLMVRSDNGGIQLQPGDTSAAGQKILQVYAARHTALITLLIERGANLEALDSAGRTPLHCAAAEGHLENVRVLVDHGANLDGKNVFGSTPLGEALSSGHGQIADFLKDRGAK